MTFKLILVIASSVIITQIAGQGACRPKNVVDIGLSNGVLVWDDSPDEVCEISYYIVTLQATENNPEMVYRVTEKSLDFTFLPPCVRHMFVVQQVSTDGVGGLYHILAAITPPPPEADFTLEFVSLTQMPQSVDLEWGLKEEWQACASHFRILIYDEDRDLPQDWYLYSMTSFSLTDLCPCTPYTIGVTAMYYIEREGTPKVLRHRTIDAAPVAPTLVRLSVRSTSIEMTWQVVDRIVLNRCTIRSVNIDASPYFAISYPVQDDPDNRRPFTVTVPGLTPDTMYFMNVTVTNSGGVSPGTPLLVQTLESD